MNTSESNGLNRASSAFALSAAITVVFNTALAWIKDSYEPLNAFMKSVSGHHWTTHGITDVVLFVVLGLIFMNMGIGQGLGSKRLITLLSGAVVVSGLGLAMWFLLV